MPILRITATPNGPCLHDAPSDALDAALNAALKAQPRPITIMVHGYKYRPGDPRHCPHQTLFCPDPVNPGPTIISWPRRLGLGPGPRSGLGVSFGWQARTTPWRAYHGAKAAGDALAVLVGQIRQQAPARTIRVVAHSMGARVTLQALSQVSAGAIDRVVLLAAAEFEAAAHHALATPGGRTASVLNITSRENDLYDFLVEALIATPKPGDRVLGAGRLKAPNLTHIQIDDGMTLETLRRAGFAIAPPAHQVCHWSGYLRPGLFPFYRAWLDGRVDDAWLRRALPGHSAPRWSRLRRASMARPGWHLDAPGA